MGEIFYWILNMSIMGTLAGLIVLLVRKIRPIPRFIAYVLWLIPCIRLLIPFGLTSQYSLMNLISKLTTRSVVIYEPQTLPPVTFTNFLMAAQEYFPITYKTRLLEQVFSVASLIWIVLAAAALIAFMLLYGLTKSEIRDATPIGDNQFLSDKVLSPAVYGFIRPKIILPKGLRQEDLPYILQHENIHIRRRDNLWRVLAIVTACIHWFNPLIWLMLKAFFADMELSCDERVLKKYGVESQKDYALALVNCEANKTMLASAFGGAKIRVRIDNILSYKKMTVFSSLCFLLLIFIIAVVLLTNTAV